MDIDLYQRRIANHLETVNLTGLDREDVSGLTIQSLSIHSPHSTPFADELNLVVRIPMPRPGPGLPMEKKYGNTRRKERRNAVVLCLRVPLCPLWFMNLGHYRKSV